MWQCIVGYPDTKGRMVTRASYTYETKDEAERQKANLEGAIDLDGVRIKVRELKTT